MYYQIITPLNVFLFLIPLNIVFPALYVLYSIALTSNQSQTPKGNRGPLFPPGQQAQENGRDQTSHLVPGSKPSQNIVPQPSTAVPKSNSAWEVVTAFTSLLSSEKKEEMDMLARTESELIAEIEQVQSELKGKIEELKKKENEIQYMLEEQKRVHKEVKEKLRDKIVELRASLRVKTGELQQKREKQEELIWSATACTGAAIRLFNSLFLLIKK